MYNDASELDKAWDIYYGVSLDIPNYPMVLRKFFSPGIQKSGETVTTTNNIRPTICIPKFT